MMAHTQWKKIIDNRITRNSIKTCPNIQLRQQLRCHKNILTKTLPEKEIFKNKYLVNDIWLYLPTKSRNLLKYKYNSYWPWKRPNSKPKILLISKIIQIFSKSHSMINYKFYRWIKKWVNRHSFSSLEMSVDKRLWRRTGE